MPCHRDEPALHLHILRDFYVMTIGLAGLGNIGFHFAARLLAAGEALAVYDVNEARLARVAELGGRSCASLQDLASQAETVILSLPMPGMASSSAAVAGRR